MRTGDIFSNIDEKTAERLSAEYPFPDDERKARLYTMSKRKLDMNDMPETGNNEVSGVEKYNRPRWYKGASIAAAAVLLVAGIGTSTVLISKNGKGPAAQVSEVTSAQVAENTALTSAAAVAATEATTEAAVDPEAVAKKLIKRYVTLGVDLNSIECDNTVYIENSNPNYTKRFYKVTDKKYSKWEDIEKAYYEIYDKATADRMLENEHCCGEDNITDNTIYLTTDNGFYVEDTSNNLLLNPEEDKYDFNCSLTPEGEIICLCTYTYSGVEYEYSGTTKYTIISTENGWRIANAELKTE